MAKRASKKQTKASKATPAAKQPVATAKTKKQPVTTAKTKNTSTQKTKRPSANNEKLKKLLLKQFVDLNPALNSYLLIPMGSGDSINKFFEDEGNGNIFRNLINLHRDDYLLLDDISHRGKRDKQKSKMALDIVNRIHSLNGKFVEWRDGDWVEVADTERLRKKTMQALRQDAPKRRQEQRQAMAAMQRHQQQQQLAMMNAAAAGFAPQHLLTPATTGFGAGVPWARNGFAAVGSGDGGLAHNVTASLANSRLATNQYTETFGADRSVLPHVENHAAPQEGTVTAGHTTASEQCMNTPVVTGVNRNAFEQNETAPQVTDAAGYAVSAPSPTEDTVPTLGTTDDDISEDDLLVLNQCLGENWEEV